MQEYTMVGRGRGIATNVPELKLIEQVRKRPLLYDKKTINYRKSTASEQAWVEVAEALQTSVANCRKRWKSLRDTFIKYYRFDVTHKNNPKKIRKNWAYYSNLLFLMPHVDLYRLDESGKSDDQQQQDNSSPIYLKEDYLNEKQIFYTTTAENAETDESVTFQIKIDRSDYDEEHITECIQEENLAEENYVERVDSGELSDIDSQVLNLANDEHTYMLITSEGNKEHEEEFPSKDCNEQASKNENSNSSNKNVADPDERYLLSCLPAFKRLTPQQKARIRMGIERLFYEVEFENDEEPRNKKSRHS